MKSFFAVEFYYAHRRTPINPHTLQIAARRLSQSPPLERQGLSCSKPCVCRDASGRRVPYARPSSSLAGMGEAKAYSRRCQSSNPVDLEDRSVNEFCQIRDHMPIVLGVATSPLTDLRLVHHVQGRCSVAWIFSIRRRRGGSQWGRPSLRDDFLSLVLVPIRRRRR